MAKKKDEIPTPAYAPTTLQLLQTLRRHGTMLPVSAVRTALWTTDDALVDALIKSGWPRQKFAEELRADRPRLRGDPHDTQAGPGPRD